MQTRTGQEVSARRLIVLAVCLALGIWFWDSPVLWPLKLLVVMMHETGHALATLLVGGSVDRISIASDESGLCLSRVPVGAFNQIVVYSAGYLGSAIAASLLLLATLRLRLRRAVPIILALWLLIMTVAYVRDVFTLIFCLAIAAILAAIARWLPDDAVDGVNLFLAAFSALYALIDLRMDLWDGAVRARSDAALLSDITWVPALVWAVVWSVIAIAIFGVTFKACIATRGKPRPEASTQPRRRMR